MAVPSGVAVKRPAITSLSPIEGVSASNGHPAGAPRFLVPWVVCGAGVSEGWAEVMAEVNWSRHDASRCACRATRARLGKPRHFGGIHGLHQSQNVARARATDCNDLGLDDLLLLLLSLSLSLSLLCGCHAVAIRLL